MATLVEIVRNYIKPPEVRELCREYAQFGELIPVNTPALPKFMRILVDRMYELSGNPPPSTTRMVEKLPQLEQKINQLERKYSKQTAWGFGAAAVSIAYLFVDVALRGIEPNLTPSTAREIGLYTSICTGALSMIHGLHSSSILLRIKDVKYRTDTVLKQALSTSKKIDG